MIPDERMAEIEKRCEAATDGPWEAEPSCAGGSYGWWVAGYDYGTYRDADFEREEDARFVAHARTDLPDLLAAYKELRAEKDATCTWTETADGQYETECGHVYEFEHCDPAENRQAYCGYCGKRIAVVAFEEDTP